jgi:predicted amidophosphoribosyltransferase
MEEPLATSLGYRLAAFLFPAVCVGCQRSTGLYLCSSCRSGLRATRSLVGGAELLALGEYRGVLQACLTAVKREGYRALAKELADLAARQVTLSWGAGPPRQVYSIRPSRSGQRFRGFSLPAAMEKAVVARTGWSSLEPALAREFPDCRFSTRRLSLEQRLERRFEKVGVPAPEATSRGPLLILDDVVTTGATLSASVARATELGFAPIVCFALAVVDDGC